jgi:hypothetical protein
MRTGAAGKMDKQYVNKKALKLQLLRENSKVSEFAAFYGFPWLTNLILTRLVSARN